MRAEDFFIASRWNLPDYFNFFTQAMVDISVLRKQVAESWHNREPYYSKHMWKVAIPATYQGASTFRSRIFAVKNHADDIEFSGNVVESPYAKGEKLVRFLCKNSVQIERAKFVDAIVCDNDYFEAAYKLKCPNYAILTAQATPTTGVPPMPTTIVDWLNGTHADFYNVAIKDLVASEIFWSHHFISK